jgi:D-3-phosphoglycerate dehydrogenase
MAFKVVDVLGVSGMFDYEEKFKKAGVSVELMQKFCSLKATENEIIAAVAGADAVIAQATYQPFSRKVLSSLKNCKFIISVGIGYDKLDVNAATEYCIMAVNVPDFCLEEVSDHTMALILACTRRVVQLHETVKRGEWESQMDPHISDIWPKMSKLKGQTLGLIGFGRVPQTLVPKAKGFGLKLIACDPYIAPEVFRKLNVKRVGLQQVLTQSDIISVHTPLNSKTTHLLGLEQFRRMKSTACVINTARGPIIDYRALYKALKQGLISTAAVDVTDPEPLPAKSPLLKLDNFIVTAHSAHASPTSPLKMQFRPAEEIIRVIKGKWPIGLINSGVKREYRKKWPLHQYP